MKVIGARRAVEPTWAAEFSLRKAARVRQSLVDGFAPRTTRLTISKSVDQWLTISASKHIAKADMSSAPVRTQNTKLTAIVAPGHVTCPAARPVMQRADWPTISFRENRGCLPSAASESLGAQPRENWLFSFSLAVGETRPSRFTFGFLRKLTRRPDSWILGRQVTFAGQNAAFAPMSFASRTNYIKNVVINGQNDKLAFIV